MALGKHQSECFLKAPPTLLSLAPPSIPRPVPPLTPALFPQCLAVCTQKEKSWVNPGQIRGENWKLGQRKERQRYKNGKLKKKMPDAWNTLRKDEKISSRILNMRGDTGRQSMGNKWKRSEFQKGRALGECSPSSAIKNNKTK